MDGSSEAHFERTFLDLAKSMELHDKYAAVLPKMSDVLTRLNSLQHENLLIVDGLETSNTLFGKRQLANYLPQSENCSILFTTRNKHLVYGLVPSANVIHLTGLNSADATQLIQELMHNAVIDPMQVSDLLAQLDYSPAAIQHAASYMTQTKIGPQAYVELLWGQDYTFGEFDSGQVQSVEKVSFGSARKVFALSYQRLSDENPLAARVLSMAAILPRTAISRRFLALLFPNPGTNEAIGLLDAFCLLEQHRNINHDDMFELGYGIQTYIRTRLSATDKERSLHTMAINTILDVLSRMEEEESPSNFISLCALYGEELLDQLSSDLRSELPGLYKKPCGMLSLAIASFHMARGSYDTAREYAKTSSDVLTFVMGKEARETLEARSLMAKALGSAGDLKAAETQWRQLLALRRGLHGDKDEETVGCINNLAMVLQEQSQFAEAETLYREALLADLEAETNMELRMRTTNNLATVLQDQDKFEEAEEFYNQVLTWRTHALGESHISTLTTMNNLGALYHLQRRWETAWDMYQTALIGMTKTLGPTHPDTIGIQTNIASMLEAQGYLVEAEFMAQRVTELYVDRVGINHVNTIAAYRLHARLLHLLERYGESEKTSRAAFKASRRVLGRDHADTVALKAQADQLREWTKSCAGR